MAAEGGYDSDEELYKTMTKYDSKIDSLLSAKSNPMPLDSFKAVLASVKEAVTIDASKPESCKSTPWLAIAAGSIVVVGGIGFALTRRKKS